MTQILFDNSYIGDVTTRITFAGQISADAISGQISADAIDSTPITIQKFDSTTFIDVASDILKGIFYLPSLGSHIGIIQKSSFDKDDNETITRARYVIRPLVETTPLSKFSPTMMNQFELELIRKQFIFAHIMRYNITEDIIEIRKMNNIHIPLLRGGASGSASDPRASTVVPASIVKKWFIPFSPKKPGVSSQSEPEIFGKAVQEFLKPHRSPITLRYKMEKLLSVYIPEKKIEYDAFLNEIVKCITPGPVKEVAKEPVRRSDRNEALKLLPLPR